MLRLEFSARKNRNENGAHSYGSEMTCEKGLSPRFYVGYDRLQCHHDWNPSEEDDEDGEYRKPPCAQPKLDVVEHLPWDDGPKVNEVGQVDQQVDDIGNVRLLCLLGEPSVIGEANTAGKADEKIIDSKNAARSRAEQGENEVEDEETLAVNHLVPFSVLDAVTGKVANQETVDGAENALVQNGVDDPVERDLFSALLLLDEVERQVDEGEGHAVVAARLSRE